ncbi:MAG: phage replication protein, partial [Cyanobacteria bacterium]|nr:phage replication protein [Cyanobacteriota bacterium]
MRARNIKAAFFKNEYLAELTPHARLLFIGLWCLADVEGRLKDSPKRIKGELFPYESVEIESLLEELATSKDRFIIRYEVGDERFIEILNFHKHQNPHKNEKEAGSKIPPPHKKDGTTPEKNGTAHEKDGTAPADSLLL